jgi:hypothetical protein
MITEPNPPNDKKKDPLLDLDLWPLHELKDGDIYATIWSAPLTKGTVFAVRIARLYLADGVWTRSYDFSPLELLRVAKIASDAYSWIRNYEDKVKSAAIYLN